MIRVSLSVLIVVYLGVFLAVIFSAWLRYEWVRKRRENRALRHRLQCAICALEFEDSTRTLLPRCPRCGSLNERYRLRAP